MVRKFVPPLYLTQADKAFLDRRGYTIGEGLSAGNFGRVFTAMRYDEKCAVKVLSLTQLSLDAKTRLLPREIYMLKKMKHSHVVEVYDIYAIADMYLLIFMEMCDGGVRLSC